LKSSVSKHDKTACSVRRAESSDAPAVASFAERVFRETFGSANTADNMRRYAVEAFGEEIQARDLADPGGVTLLAETGDALAAFAQLRFGEAPSCVVAKRPAEIVRFYVDRPWHGRGVAQSLMAAVRLLAQRRGSDRLWLGVWEGNARAIAFYEKNGFLTVGDQPFMLGLVMVGGVESDEKRGLGS
jgi:ribosomal protein S18 acetylase RimI-like enzyme